MALARRQRGRWSGAVALLYLTACATVEGPQEETPPEVPSARLFRYMPPGTRDRMLPAPQVFEARSYLDRLVCREGDQPGWRRVDRSGLIEHVQVSCPGEPPQSMVLDTGGDPPPAPPGLRVISPKGFPHYLDAMHAAEKKDYQRALAELNAALAEDPSEPVYRRERLFCLYSLGEVPSALMEADELIETYPWPTLFKYRALVARDMGLRSEVLASVEGIIQHTHSGHPLYGEPVCAKGLILDGDGDASAEKYIREGCALDNKPCCDALRNRRALEQKLRETQAAVRATEAIGIHLPASPVPHQKADEQAPGEKAHTPEKLPPATPSP